MYNLILNSNKMKSKDDSCMSLMRNNIRYKKEFLRNIMHISLLTFFALGMSGCSQTKKVQRIYGDTFYQEWIHAHEESSGNQMVFRSIDHQLPPARGRIGLELRKGGDVIYTGIGPADIPEKSNGKWKLKGKDKLILTLDDQSSHNFKIIELRSDKLTVQKL
jgi:hypothetical protein